MEHTATLRAMKPVAPPAIPSLDTAYFGVAITNDEYTLHLLTVFARRLPELTVVVKEDDDSKPPGDVFCLGFVEHDATDQTLLNRIGYWNQVVHPKSPFWMLPTLPKPKGPVCVLFTIPHPAPSARLTARTAIMPFNAVYFEVASYARAISAVVTNVAVSSAWPAYSYLAKAGWTEGADNGLKQGLIEIEGDKVCVKIIQPSEDDSDRLVVRRIRYHQSDFVYYNTLLAHR